ncbi:GtrA family protein [Herbiconiux sp. L3-i23]|uniref:GtrA family protein n=1 Tax=Herbiconiux sp. L3-i23 TaxID=2905871 RepID=UPI002051A655|nr:GtrA family protein [Herbiconiux sp. L3-i23]BDI21613.1 hypothetical protein L3i23_03890 [Herbiconiux sp. L3-i23]
MRTLLHSGARFLLVGAISTAIELSLFNLFLVGLGWSPVAAKVVSSLVALISAYVGNREWAFRGRPRGHRGREAALFIAVNVVCTALGAGIVALGTALLGDGPLVVNAVNVVSIGIVVVLRFVLYHSVVFREQPVAAAAAAQEGAS